MAEEFEGRLESRHQRMMATSRRNVSRLQLLIDDLLTLSRAESHATDMEQIDLAQVLHEVIIDVRVSASRRRIGIELDGRCETPAILLADRVMLHRAFLNVVSNAVKFGHDHGIGIPESELARLGTRFFRASNAVSQRIGGTGLGVRVVQTIVDKHAGEMVVESSEGEGTTITIRLNPHGATPTPPARPTAISADV